MKDNLTHEDIKLALENSNSKTELANKLGFNYINGRVSRIIKNILHKQGLVLPKFDIGKRRRKYKKIVKNCPVCNSKFETQLNHPREKTVCSHTCSNIYFKRNSAESNKKKSETLIKYYIKLGRHSGIINGIKKCLTCGNEFKASSNNHKYCSKECRPKRIITEKTKLKLKELALQRVTDGTHTGWKSREKCNRSWAEQFVETEILNVLGFYKDIHFKTEYYQGKWFIDFAFVKDKIAIEIDGRQHNLPERKAKDKEKDLWLVNNGWVVYRIPWKKPNEQTKIKLTNIIKQITKYVEIP